MPFGNAYHGDGGPVSPGGRPAGLGARIDAELRARIEEAVDYACLDAMVRVRQARGSAPPVSDNPRDREEFMSRVSAFLEQLRVDILATLDAEQRRRLDDAVTSPRTRNLPSAVAAQVSLAKALPDYWQRFEAIRMRTTGEAAPSGRERRGLLDPLLGRD